MSQSPRMIRPPRIGRRLRFAVEAMLARTALALLGRLSPVAASNLGGVVARSIGPWLPVSQVADGNLALALPRLDAAARRQIIRGVWDNLGRTVAELPHVARLEQTASGPGWEIEGESIVRALAATGGPAIFFSGHLGNWELLPRAASHFGLSLASFYRAAANPAVDRLIVDLRRQGAGRPTTGHSTTGHPTTGREVAQFAKGAAGARGALAHLRAGGMLGMLIDQKMNDGIETPLFDQPAMTAPAAAAFALRFNCPLVPAWVQRLGPARFRVTCEPPLPLPATGNRQEDIATLTQQMNQALERQIRARPEQWLWLHRRWPKRPAV